MSSAPIFYQHAEQLGREFQVVGPNVTVSVLTLTTSVTTVADDVHDMSFIIFQRQIELPSRQMTSE